MKRYMTSIVEGDDYFYNECSECTAKVVTLRKYNHPVQCSNTCQEKHVLRIKQSFKVLQEADELGLESESINLEIYP